MCSESPSLPEQGAGLQVFRPCYPIYSAHADIRAGLGGPGGRFIQARRGLASTSTRRLPLPQARYRPPPFCDTAPSRRRPSERGGWGVGGSLGKHCHHHRLPCGLVVFTDSHRANERETPARPRSRFPRSVRAPDMYGKRPHWAGPARRGPRISVRVRVRVRVRRQLPSRIGAGLDRSRAGPRCPGSLALLAGVAAAAAACPQERPVSQRGSLGLSISTSEDGMAVS